jgi:hypothetical protein
MSDQEKIKQHVENNLNNPETRERATTLTAKLWAALKAEFDARKAYEQTQDDVTYIAWGKTCDALVPLINADVLVRNLVAFGQVQGAMFSQKENALHDIHVAIDKHDRAPEGARQVFAKAAMESINVLAVAKAIFRFGTLHTPDHIHTLGPADERGAN